MGGKGSGGRRPGSGPKKKSAHLRGIDGGASHSGTAPSAPTETKRHEPFPPPGDLFNEDLMTWEKMAPLAFEQRTLTPATAYAFSLLCRNIVLERRMSVSPLAVGGADHRNLIQRIDAELLAFNLRPNGKPLYEAAPVEKPASPLSKFRVMR